MLKIGSSSWRAPVRALSSKFRSGSGSTPTPVTVFRGDGIGPEITDATVRILKAAGAPLEYEYAECGEKLYLAGNTSGVNKESWESIDRTKLLLKGPITTPLGGGYKSVNVTLRKTLGLFSNVRPVRSYDPFIQALAPKMDIVIVRENEEDLYAGVEHRQTYEVFQCLKLVSRPGIERICRYAFEYARRHGRKKVTCVTKNNIMKITDGEFARIFFEMAKQYPDLESDHAIIDIATARLASRPDRYDVIVTLNLYGDIMSDVAAEVAGSVGCASSANIGDEYAMFEAVHGSAPDIAGKGIANPSGLLQAASLMLTHVGAPDTAALIQNAWLRTIEDGQVTGDMRPSPALSGSPRHVLGTDKFADAIIARLGQQPRVLQPVVATPSPKAAARTSPAAAAPLFKNEKRDLVGVDVFLCWQGENGKRDSNRLAEALMRLVSPTGQHGATLEMLSNRGVKIWPNPHKATSATDHWRCRFKFASTAPDYAAVLSVLNAVARGGLDIVKTENLYLFDGKPGYSLGQGQ